MYFIPQITSSDCLFTAFKMLLANVREDKDFLFIQENEKHGPYSFLEIINLGRSYGLDLFGFEADEKRDLYKSGGTPMILNLRRGGDILHSVYVYKVTQRRVYYLDSDIGKVSMPYERFLLLWNGTGLMLKRVFDGTKSVTKFDIPTKRNIVGKILQTITTILFALALYFINDETITKSLIFIFSALGVEITNKIIEVVQMKRFDVKTRVCLQRIQTRNFHDYLPRREKLKLSIFSQKNNYFYYLLCSIFVVFVILLNNPMHVACVFVPIIFAVIQSLIISPLEKRKTYEIEQKEVKLSKEKGCAPATRTLREIEKESYRFTYRYVLKNGIGIILFFLVAYLTLNYLKSISLLNVIFLSFTEIFLYQNLLPIFTFESRRNDFNFNYMRFINLLQ